MLSAKNVKYGYPKEWEIMDKDGYKISTGIYTGFKDSPSVNRFAARFRAAKLYKSSEFTHMTPDLEKAYCGFTRIMLSYAAFDFLLMAMKIKQKNCYLHISHHPIDDWLDEIRKIDPACKLHSHLLTFSNQDNKEQIKKFISGKNCNYTYLASSIRHAFAHGFLTPNGGACSPSEVSSTCENISEKLLILMDSIFEQRMLELQKA